MARNSNEGRIDQNLVDDDIPHIEWRRVHEPELSSSDLDWLEGNKVSLPSVVGMSAAFAKKGSVPAIALAVASRDTNISSRCLVVILASATSTARDNDGRTHLTSRLLENKSHTIYSFDLAPTILLLNHFHSLHFVQAIDIQSALPIKGREPLRAIKFMLGSSADVAKRPTTEAFDNLDFEDTPKVLTQLVLRAWISAFSCSSETEGLEAIFAAAPKVDTTKFKEWQLFDLSKLAHDQHRQDAEKSSTTANNVATLEWSHSKQKLEAKSGRYQTRLTDRNSDVVMTVGDQATGTYRVRGQVAKADGKSAAIKTEIMLDGKAISGMTTVGRSQHTTAEQSRAQYVLDILQGKFRPWDNPWLKAINGDLSAWPEEWAAEKSPSAFIEETTYPLNASQLYAIRHMLSPSPDAHVTLIQGPPGTGKTSVIATYVSCSIQAGRRGIWLVAQSNVAVKNIAEKLLKINFAAFRLLVSKDFKFDWHDHLYQGLDRNIIESGQFPKTPAGFRDAVGGVQVILCTLSMLSNPRLPGFFKQVPLKHLVIDEASQIEIGNYATIFNNGTALRKVCFIGDDKQLPPHGTEEIEVLESIFEKRHLRDAMCFLDTQYRMPPQIGAFISTEVYNGNLDSNPEHPVTDATVACRFIDVVGASEQKSGTSWVNRKEIEAVTHLVRRLQAENEQVRVITPYDAQRNAIEEALKNQEDGLKWTDTVFNVDSFQGNEEDYIVVSLVRTRDLGFLKSLRRTNVMLSRCKRGMYICSSRAFLIDGRGAESLAGKMAAHFGEPAWISMADLEGGNY